MNIESVFNASISCTKEDRRVRNRHQTFFNVSATLHVGIAAVRHVTHGGAMSSGGSRLARLPLAIDYIKDMISFGKLISLCP